MKIRQILTCIIITAAIFFFPLTMPDLAGFIRDEGPWAFIFLGAIAAIDCYLWYVTDEPDKSWLLCVRKDQMKKPIMGRIEGKCSQCGATVWVPKNGLDVPKEAEPICTSCILEELRKDKDGIEAIITPMVREELHQKGWTDEKILANLILITTGLEEETRT